MHVLDYETKADIFQMLSHPVRLQILDELRRREACVCHLQAVTGRPQAYVSQQLRFLREAGLVRDEKEGQNVFYYLEEETIHRVLLAALGPVLPPTMLPECSCPFCGGE